MNGSQSNNKLPQLIAGYWISQAIHVAAKLKVADRLANGPRAVSELASLCSADEANLYRLLRALASLDIFSETDEATFGLTPMASQLRSDDPDSQWAMAMMMGQENYQAWGQLFHTVTTGEAAFESVFGRTIFEYLDENPQAAEIFNQAMMSSHGRDTGPMVEAYDFSGIKKLLDIGGGNGTLLAAVLASYPTISGTLFELPHVLESAKATFEAHGLGARSAVVSGNFFESIPGGADAIMMRHVIHNWDDKQAVRILQNCYRALPLGGRLLIIESVISAPPNDSFAKLLDLSMMVLVDGAERTEEQYKALLEAAGFEYLRILPTATKGSFVEAVKSA